MSLGITLVIGGVGLATAAWLKGHADAPPKETVPGGSFFVAHEATRKEVQRQEDMDLRAEQRKEDLARQKREREQELKLRSQQRAEDLARAAKQRREDKDLAAKQRMEDRERAATWRGEDRDLRVRERTAQEFLSEVVGATMKVTRWHEEILTDGNGDIVEDRNGNPEMHRVAGAVTGEVMSVGGTMLSLIENQTLGGVVIDTVLHRIPLGDIIKVQSA